MNASSPGPTPDNPNIQPHAYRRSAVASRLGRCSTRFDGGFSSQPSRDGVCAGAFVAVYRIAQRL